MARVGSAAANCRACNSGQQKISWALHVQLAPAVWRKRARIFITDDQVRKAAPAAEAQSTVARYMAKKGNDPSGQRWGTFLRNHMPQIAAMDLFVVPTIGFRLLYALVIIRLARLDPEQTSTPCL